MTFEEAFKHYFAYKEAPGDSSHVVVKVSDLKRMWEDRHRGDTGPPGLITPVMMNFVSKRWGWESWICNNQSYCGKKLFIKQGYWLSYHHHEEKDEVLYVESGLINFTSDIAGSPQTMEMKPGYAFHVIPHLRHQIEAVQDTILFEFSTHHEDSDSYRTTIELVREQGEIK